MDTVPLPTLFDWLQQNPLISLVLVFLVACGESLAVVGLIVPGALLMVGFGALIALDYLAFAPTVIAAMLGAIAGDGISYWLGVKYNRNLATIWPFSRYPDLLNRGELFFQRHGGKSVLLGRFVGPLRPIIPAIAGMLHMPMRQFFLINIFSALLWAPLYLLPGIIFGASLELASEFAGRFTLLLAGLVFGLWLIVWLIRLGYLWFIPFSDAFMARIVNWSRRHPLAGEIPAAIVEPEHPEIRGLSLLAIVLLLTTVGFILLSQLAGHFPFMHGLNQLVFHALQALHNPPFDHAMVFITGMGDIWLLTGLVILTAVYLFITKQHLALWHWLAAFIFPLLLVELLKQFYALPRPPGIEMLQGYAYPSGHATLATATYGFLAILLARDVRPAYRLAIYIFASLLILLIAFSRLYLGAHWLTDVIGGMLLGLAWAALLGIAYRRHASAQYFKRTDLAFIGSLLTISLLAYPGIMHNRQFVQYQPISTQYFMTEQAWLESGWQALPSVREDLRGHNDFVFNLQWTGTADEITAALETDNWHLASTKLRYYFNWFNPSATIKELPLLPHMHDGQYEILRFTRIIPPDRFFVIRLWRSQIEIQNREGKQPLWFGYISQMGKVERFGLRYLVTTHDFDTPLQWFQSHLPGGRATPRTLKNALRPDKDIKQYVLLLETH
jgi:membrane protein DedA with SNARE-associated domain/membrane-associated phospholipid phosphatase